jgi:hypothetical protein
MHGDVLQSTPAAGSFRARKAGFVLIEARAERAASAVSRSNGREGARDESRGPVPEHFRQHEAL